MEEQIKKSFVESCITFCCEVERFDASAVASCFAAYTYWKLSRSRAVLTAIAKLLRQQFIYCLADLYLFRWAGSNRWRRTAQFGFECACSHPFLALGCYPRLFWFPSLKKVWYQLSLALDSLLISLLRLISRRQLQVACSSDGINSCARGIAHYQQITWR